MCGFVGMFDIKNNTSDYRKIMLELSKRIRHRGPDWSGIYQGERAVLSHERLAIIDPMSGKQPLYNEDKSVVLVVNGEIYNHMEIRESLKGKYKFSTNSDCEVILGLYQEKGADFLEDLNGIFAFAIYDSKKDFFMVARDHLGIIPLYQGYDTESNYMVASELKALEGYCETLSEFPPGSYMCNTDRKIKKWYKRDWTSYDNVKDSKLDEKDLKTGLEKAVVRQLMSDVPYGVLLSGGLDSSIIAAVAARYCRERVETNMEEEAWWPRLHSFSIGLKGSPDLVAARKAAAFIGTVHHEVVFTIQEALDAIDDVIYHLETYDITTVRAATPMYLLARFIKSMGIKMILSGEGADELFGGYLYFHKAPNAKEFHEETVRKISKLHLYDLLRANKALAAWGVEGRVPFLDKDFIDIAMNIAPEKKMCTGKIEKEILRKAFEDYLPKEIVWRQKEQFSDGVGYSWIDHLKEYTEKEISDETFKNAFLKYPVNTPSTKEEYYYRTVFTRHFPSASAANCVPHEASVACSTAVALSWDESFSKVNEPSGRAVKGVHVDSYK